MLRNSNGGKNGKEQCVLLISITISRGISISFAEFACLFLFLLYFVVKRAVDMDSTLLSLTVPISAHKVIVELWDVLDGFFIFTPDKDNKKLKKKKKKIR